MGGLSARRVGQRDREIEPAAHFCKQNKSNLFELVGVDEYANIIRHNYGPSNAIYRNGIEFLQCK